jgi:hypothetical protein
MKRFFKFEKELFLFLKLVEFYLEKDGWKRPFCKIKKYQS